MPDEIKIDNLEIFANHGVYPEEKSEGQFFYVNAVLYTDLRPSGLKDDLTLSTHYGEVSLFIKKCLTEHTYDLIETAAEVTAEKILLAFPPCQSAGLGNQKAPCPYPYAI